MLSYLRNVRFLVLVGLLVLAAVLHVANNEAAREGRSLRLEDGIRVVLRPFQVAGAKLGGGGKSVARSLRTRSAILRENDTLRAEVRRLSQENSALRDQAEQNVRLRKALEFKESFPLPLLSSHVIGRSASGWFSTCVIDRGTRDGVQPGHAVATFRGLVGQVYKASQTSSSVLMLSDSSSAIGAIVQRSRVNGICQGQNSDVLILKYLPIDADAKPGDIVVSSGIGRLVPKGITIGRITEVKADRGGFTKHALVSPSAKFEQLEHVFVVVRAVEE